MHRNEPDPGDYFEREYECEQCDAVVTKRYLLNGQYVCLECFNADPVVQAVLQADCDADDDHQEAM